MIYINEIPRVKECLLLLFAVFCVSCGPTGGSDSPSNSLKDFVMALKEQNPGKAWNYLSQNTQLMYDGIARNRNMSGKEYFEKSVSDAGSLGTLGMDFDVVDEKKEDDKATVVIKMKGDGSVSEFYSVKEDGVWKLDYARTLEESIKKVE